MFFADINCWQSIVRQNVDTMCHYLFGTHIDTVLRLHLFSSTKDDVDVSSISRQMTSQAKREHLPFRVNRLFSAVLKGLHVYMPSRALKFVSF